MPKEEAEEDKGDEEEDGETIEFDPARPYLTEKWLNATHYKEACEKFDSYDPDLWLPTLTMRMTPFMFYPWFIITLLVTILTWFVQSNQQFMHSFSVSSDAHVILGGALSFLVVFRTNSSYDRWWEARCAWQTVITTCRTLGAMTCPALQDEEAREMFMGQIIAFCVALKAFVRDEKIDEEECGPRIDPELVEELNKSSCLPLMALRIMAHTLRTRCVAWGF